MRVALAGRSYPISLKVGGPRPESLLQSALPKRRLALWNMWGNRRMTPHPRVRESVRGSQLVEGMRLVESNCARLRMRSARRGAGAKGSRRFQPQNLGKAVRDAVGEMCPNPAPATQEGPGNGAFLFARADDGIQLGHQKGHICAPDASRGIASKVKQRLLAFMRQTFTGTAISSRHSEADWRWRGACRPDALHRARGLRPRFRGNAAHRCLAG